MTPEIGEEIPTLHKHATAVAMFRFSAVMWNAHRTHIDHPYATEEEGHKSTLAQDYLLATYLTEMLMNWIGPTGRVKRLSYRNRLPVYANTRVRCWGRITAVREAPGAIEVDLDVGVNNEEGQTCVPATATVLIRRN